MKKQSNAYALTYAVGLVLVVGVVLSLIYQSLRPEQQANAANDTRAQILKAALITGESKDIASLWEKHITDAFIVDYHGNVVNRDPQAAFQATLGIAAESKKPADQRLLPVFQCATDAGVKYILPVYGAGLWGPIWGYVAFNDNGDTIYGAYFAHQGETPGLGAEIEKPAFSDQFQGKEIFSGHGKFLSVRVCKPGQEPSQGAWVNGISGGTITSQGVDRMLRDSLEPYTNYLKTLNSRK